VPLPYPTIRAGDTPLPHISYSIARSVKGESYCWQYNAECQGIESPLAAEGDGGVAVLYHIGLLLLAQAGTQAHFHVYPGVIVHVRLDAPDTKAISLARIVELSLRKRDGVLGEIPTSCLEVGE
jgi:hypothetical protein